MTMDSIIVMYFVMYSVDLMDFYDLQLLIPITGKDQPI